MNNHYVEIYKQDTKLKKELEELILRVLDKYPRLQFIGVYRSIEHYERVIKQRGYTFNDFLEECTDDLIEDGNFTLNFTGDLTSKQRHELSNVLPQCIFRHYAKDYREYYMFIFDFSQYFFSDYGEDYIEPYQIKNR